jgi:hypothetical protein
MAEDEVKNDRPVKRRRKGESDDEEDDDVFAEFVGSGFDIFREKALPNAMIRKDTITEVVVNMQGLSDIVGLCQSSKLINICVSIVKNHRHKCCSPKCKAASTSMAKDGTYLCDEHAAELEDECRAVTDDDLFSGVMFRAATENMDFLVQANLPGVIHQCVERVADRTFNIEAPILARNIAAAKKNASQTCVDVNMQFGQFENSPLNILIMHPTQTKEATTLSSACRSTKFTVLMDVEGYPFQQPHIEATLAISAPSVAWSNAKLEELGSGMYVILVVDELKVPASSRLTKSQKIYCISLQSEISNTVQWAGRADIPCVVKRGDAEAKTNARVGGNTETLVDSVSGENVDLDTFRSNVRRCKKENIQRVMKMRLLLDPFRRLIKWGTKALDEIKLFKINLGSEDANGIVMLCKLAGGGVMMCVMGEYFTFDEYD